ncbi:MAG: hypothetical protein IKA87_09445, partial [Lentisphaeria bacterium]|nr:hypothetical protein [Lentisphaeria bacterium]
TQSEFISSVSHELRTPLTAITGWAETIQSGELQNPKDVKKGMDIIVSEARRLLEGDGTLKITIGDKFCCFEASNFKLSSKLIEGNYPNYRSVVPSSFERIITLPVEALLSKVETVSLMLPDDTSSVVLNFTEKSKVTIEAVSSELGEGSDYVDVEFEGDDFDVSFNPKFLVDPLRTTGAETISMKLNDPLMPVALEAEEGFINVIMPIRKKAVAQQQ